LNASRATYREFCGGYQALVRLPRDGALKPILGPKGRPKLYDTALAAQIAATEALCAYWNGRLRRDGERLCAAKTDAERLFARAADA
jgi:hypothetical protein